MNSLENASYKKYLKFLFSNKAKKIEIILTVDLTLT